MSDKERMAALEKELGLKKQNRWLYLFGIILLVLIIAVVGADLLLNQWKSVTKGLNPQEVVELFYSAVNKLDSFTITHAIDPRYVTAFHSRIVLNTLSGNITNMQDISHINRHVASNAVVYSPEQWFKKGRPPLVSGERVLGIDNLVIRRLHHSRYEVTYDYYLTGVPEEGKPVLPFATRCVDICSLDKKTGDWLIVGIDQISETPLALE
ncbi:MAG: hypothetical protein JW881_01450 [Spirochaetales bacterium]|nr:hypothetical protein [Spirochaetales bacterium]